MIGRLKDNLEVPNNQPWAEPFRFWVGRTKATPAPLAGGTAKLRLRGCSNEPIDLGVEVLDNVLTIQMAATAMSAIDEGTYDLQILAELETGDVRQVRGVVDIIGGF